jgi:hypothetical protein
VDTVLEHADAPGPMGLDRGMDAITGSLITTFDWRAGLTRLTPSEWSAPLGPAWGPYADTSTIDLALHVLDEVIHHGAEVGLLRDLYFHRSSLAAEAEAAAVAMERGHFS